jgi:hypothetical protein
MTMRRTFAILLVLGAATPALARDSLGMFSGWGAFRDPGQRCYAIAKANPSAMSRDFQPYADVAIWPGRGVRGQVHFRLSRPLAGNSQPQLAIGGQRIPLRANAATGDVWAADKRGDAMIVATMRSAGSMTASARDARGRGFSNTWQLAGAATAMDAASLGCAGMR